MWYDEDVMVNDQLKPDRWWEIGKGLIELANLQIIALLFGQAFTGFQFNWRLAILSISLWLWLYSLALTLMKKKGGNKK